MSDKIRWQDREHSSHVTAKYFSAGWEFETAQEARDYVSHQYARQSPDDRSYSPFRFEVKSNGVHIMGWHGSFDMVIRKATYASGETMRDAKLIDSPSDCYWIVPNTGEHD